MLILHAGYVNDELYFWGEHTAKVLPPKADGKKSAAPLPTDAGEEILKKNLVQTLFDSSIRKRPVTPALMWLPTADGTPLCSSPTLAGGTVVEAKPVLAPWKVTSINVGLENTIGFLAACVNKELLDSGIMVGPDLQFWVRTVRFAGALVARQQYLPDLVKFGEYQALWDPIFIGNDAEYLAQLVQAMPSACRALSIDETAKKPPNVSAMASTSNFVVSVVDYLARNSIFSQPQATWPKSFRVDEDFKFDSVHDHWLNALVSPEPTLTDPKGDLRELQSQIREWRKPISVSAKTPFRLCLRLEEPPPAKGKNGSSEEEPRWFVHFLLQSLNAPEQLIPADRVWAPTKEDEKLLNCDGFDAKEFLLSSLGLASTICHRIETALLHEAPVGYELDTSAAWEFLTQRTYALEQAGFGAITPEWWTGTGTRRRLSTRASVRSSTKAPKGNFSLDQLLDFEWEVTLGGETVDRAELDALARIKVPLVRMRGQWVQLGDSEIKNAIELISHKKNNKGTLRSIVQMALGSAKPPGDFAFEGVTASGWISEFLGKLESDDAFEELKVPAKLNAELRPYQIRGFSWLAFLQKWGLGACLADDMGLGKTIQALTLVQHDWQEGNRKPVLVICPTSLTGNWAKEAQRFTPDLPVLVHHGVNRNKGLSFEQEASGYALVISSYSLLHRDIEEFKKIHWRGAILDEAQNIKNPKTKQARSARSIQADYRIALTGTPIENHVGDLWSLMEFLNGGFLGSQAEFKRTFLMPIQANHDNQATEKLRRLTGPFILRRLKTDKTIIKDLPNKLEMKTYCNLTKEQAGLYETLVRDIENGLDAADGIQRKGLVLAALTKLKQICNHPAQYLSEPGPLDKRSGKLARLTEMLEEIFEVGERALVFTQFVEMGKIIQQHLQETFGRETLFLHGGVPKNARDKMIDRFQEEEDGPSVFVLSLKAGGTGLNLTRANHVFHYDRWWNPAVEDQATDRVYRIGQTRNVQIHKFVCVGTLEERVDDMLEMKKGLASQIVGADEAWLTELSTRDLKKLFQLQSHAIGD